MEDEGYVEGSQSTSEAAATRPASTHALDARQQDLVRALIAANHHHLVERGGAKELLREDALNIALPEQWMGILSEPDAARRRDLAWLLMLSLPTPALSDLQDRVRPLVSLDLLGLLPAEVSRHILSQLDVASILNASRVCKAWRALAWDDQLLWRALYERQGWTYDDAAVNWWNAQSAFLPLSRSMSYQSTMYPANPDEGMAFDEEDHTHQLLSPPKRRDELQDTMMQEGGRTSPMGLPPSPRHIGFPPLRSTPSPSNVPDDDDDVVMHSQSTMSRASSANGTPTRAGSLPPLGLRRSSTMKSSRSAFSESLKQPAAPLPPPPGSFDPSGVSRVHYDSDGRPWVSWRHLFRARHLLDHNWRHGNFEMHELLSPMLHYTSRSPPPIPHHPPGAAYAEGVYAIQFDGDRLVAGLRGGSAMRFDMRSGKMLRSYRFHTGSVLCLQYDTYDTKLEGVEDRLVTGSSDGHAVIWDLESGKLLQVLHGHTQSVLSVRFCRDVLATCSKDRNVLLWRMSTGDCTHVLAGHRSAVNALSFQNGLVVSASGDREIRVWSAETGECLRVLGGHLGGIAALYFDGKVAATGSSDSTVRLTDIVTGACAVEIGTPDPAGDRMRMPVNARADDPLALWAAGRTAGLSPVMGHAHTDLVRTLAFDSRYIVTGSYDETIKVWDRHTGMLLLDIHAHSTRVFNLQFDVSRLISCSQAGVEQIRVFDFLPDEDVSFLTA